jgi:hypothetical protein
LHFLRVQVPFYPCCLNVKMLMEIDGGSKNFLGFFFEQRFK